MTRKLFVLKDVTDFAPGAFENTVVDNGSIRLGLKGTSYLPSGTYTGAPFTPLPFFTLVPSWNADTPPGTTVEVQARVATHGHWSRWFSFGNWCPFIDRASPPPQEDEIARTDGEFLSVVNRSVPADTAQLRIILTTDDPAVTPMVRLLAISVDSPQAEETRHVSERVLEPPAYSCLVRDPAIDERTAGACSLTMLMNRWGEDVLPEEVARSAYDSGSGRYGNLAFLCAAGGMYGFECFIGFGSINALRKEIWRGNSVGVRVHYRTNLLSHEPDPQEEPIQEELPEVEAAEISTPQTTSQAEGSTAPTKQFRDALRALPMLEGATVDSVGHLIVLCGFINDEEKGEQVVIHDPLSHQNKDVRRTISLKQFEEIYMGTCLMLRKGSRKAGKAKPIRRVARMDISEGKIHLQYKNETLIPGTFSATDLSSTTICYTLSESVTYASAAQHKFYYPSLNKDGNLNIDLNIAQGRKLTLYLIGNRGITWVADKQIQKAQPAPAPQEENLKTQPPQL